MPVSQPFMIAERYIQGVLSYLPHIISRWLGHRGQRVPSSSLWVYCLWGFIGAFGGIGVLFAVFGHTDSFTARDVPPIVTSFGASAILCYGAIESPFAQARSLIFGHFFSALIGIIVSIIFDFNLQDNIAPRFQWLAASLAVSIALVVMHLTQTTHPPAGATALLPVVDPHIWALKWYFLPVVLLSSSVVMGTALLVNNVQRQWPIFWITPIPPAMEDAPRTKRKHGRRSPGPNHTVQQSSPRRDHSLQDLEAHR